MTGRRKMTGKPAVRKGSATGRACCFDEGAALGELAGQVARTGYVQQGGSTAGIQAGALGRLVIRIDPIQSSRHYSHW